MIIIDYLIKYHFIFRIYMFILMLFNLMIFYFFCLKKIYKNDSVLDNIDYDLKYFILFKKILNIINNPIIFEYQLKHSHKIDSNSDKFIEYYKFLNYVQNKNFTKITKSKKYYRKIIKLLQPHYSNKNEKIIILTKLLCINF